MGAEREDRYARYANAHHDLWWARTQQWSVANWAVLLIAAITGVGRTLTPEWRLTLYQTWPYVVGIILVAGVAGWLFGTLHDDIVHNREVYRALENQTGIEELRTKLPGQDRGTTKTDWCRNLETVMLMLVAIATASSFAVLLLGGDWDRAVKIAVVTLAVDVVFVLRFVRRWTVRQRVCKQCPHRFFMHGEHGRCFGRDCDCAAFKA